MATMTVTPAQAQYLARLSEAVRVAQQQYADAITLLTLGNDVGVLTHINTDDGTLTFADA